MGEARQYRLSYLPLFWADLNEAVTYVSTVLDSPKAAERLLNEVEEAILAHRQNPTCATVYRTTRARRLPYYWFAVGNYMVFYVVDGDVMEVRRMLYGARDLTKMLP